MSNSLHLSALLTSFPPVKTETPIWTAFGRGWTFHHFGLAIVAVFSTIATIIAGFLMLQHARHYSKPWEQKHIIRILFMIPVYAVVSLVSYVFYKHAIYWEVLRDCYEAFAIASFFTLLCHYLEPTLKEQKNHFREVTPRNWVWPIPWCQKCSGGPEKGAFRIPRSGLTWFNVRIFLKQFTVARHSVQYRNHGACLPIAVSHVQIAIAKFLENLIRKLARSLAISISN